MINHSKAVYNKDFDDIFIEWDDIPEYKLMPYDSFPSFLTIQGKLSSKRFSIQRICLSASGVLVGVYKSYNDGGECEKVYKLHILKQITQGQRDDYIKNLQKEQNGNL